MGRFPPLRSPGRTMPTRAACSSRPHRSISSARRLRAGSVFRTRCSRRSSRISAASRRRMLGLWGRRLASFPGSISQQTEIERWLSSLARSRSRIQLVTVQGRRAMPNVENGRFLPALLAEDFGTPKSLRASNSARQGRPQNDELGVRVARRNRPECFHDRR
jgi:hypothetical protein